MTVSNASGPSAAASLPSATGKARAGRAGVVAEIAERRRADIERELGERTYSQLADAAADYSAALGTAPRSVVERFAAPGLHLIAEVKRRSPSVGAIAADADPVARARAYAAGGASAISVLCEPHWFGGAIADLQAVRAAVSVPVLAKEFVVDDRQLPMLRLAGADMVLLLACLHTPKKLAQLVERACDLGLEPLVEAHDEREVEVALASGARLIGLNNRNLRTLDVDPELCMRLRALVPADRLAVGESGLNEARTLVGWRAVGLDAALVGEALMRAHDPESAVRSFVAAGAVPHDIAAEARGPMVKICGIADSDGLMAALRPGADAIGINLVPGTPRYVTLSEAAYLATKARGSSPTGAVPRIVAVFADASAEEIDAAISAFAPDAIQLSGSEPASLIRAVRRPVWKVLHLPADGATVAETPDLRGTPSVAADAASSLPAATPGLAGAPGLAAVAAIAAGREYLAAGAERLILDTAGGPFPGGTGRQVARRIAAEVAREIPVVLAGGLDAANVRVTDEVDR